MNNATKETVSYLKNYPKYLYQIIQLFTFRLQIYVQSSQKALHKKAKKIPISQIMHIFILKMYHFYLIMKIKMSLCEMIPPTYKDTQT